MSSLQTEFVEQSDCSSECNVDDTFAQTRPKKKVKPTKRYCVFRSEWLKEEGMSWQSKVADFTANCTLCRQFFSVKYDGKSAVSSHAKSTKHKKDYYCAEAKQNFVCFFR